MDGGINHSNSGGGGGGGSESNMIDAKSNSPAKTRPEPGTERRESLERSRQEGGTMPFKEKENETETEEEDKGGRLMFSYAVLTTSAAPRLRWLHQR